MADIWRPLIPRPGRSMPRASRDAGQRPGEQSQARVQHHRQRWPSAELPERMVQTDGRAHPEERPDRDRGWSRGLSRGCRRHRYRSLLRSVCPVVNIGSRFERCSQWRCEEAQPSRRSNRARPPSSQPGTHVRAPQNHHRLLLLPAAETSQNAHGEALSHFPAAPMREADR